MSVREFKKLANPDLNRLQDNIGTALKPLLDSPIGDGILLQDISVSASTVNVVSHGLQRIPRGFFIVKNNVAVSVWEPTPSTNATRVLQLSASANAIISLWVF